jgi:hypothetical protein
MNGSLNGLNNTYHCQFDSTEAIEVLHAAGLNVWMITGDKVKLSSFTMLFFLFLFLFFHSSSSSSSLSLLLPGGDSRCDSQEVPPAGRQAAVPGEDHQPVRRAAAPEAV